MSERINRWNLSEAWVAARVAPLARAIDAMVAGARSVPLGDNGSLWRELAAQLEKRAQLARQAPGDCG